MFDKVLVANRGEIAIRIFRTLRELGIASVAVYSDADRGAPHVARADEATLSAGDRGRELSRRRRCSKRPRRSGAEAVHPGYGFLAENAAFARAVEARARRGSGRRPRDRADGQKTPARQAMQAAGVPIIPGTTDPSDRPRRSSPRRADRLPAPDQGGGRRRRQGDEGRRVRRRGRAAFESAQREGQSYFADPSVYVERYLEDPRHVEVQVLADAHGT